MLALLAYRSTPHVSTGFSPAQLLMGRRIQSRLPTLPSALQPKWPNLDVISENDRLAKESSTRFYNRKHSAKLLTQFEGGESVRIKTDAQKVWGNPTVVVRADTPRTISYSRPTVLLSDATGVTYRKFLYPLPNVNLCQTSHLTVLQRPIHQRSLKDQKSFLNLLEVLRLLVRLNQLFQPQLPGLVE